MGNSSAGTRGGEIKNRALGPAHLGWRHRLLVRAWGTRGPPPRVRARAAAAHPGRGPRPEPPAERRGCPAEAEGRPPAPRPSPVLATTREGKEKEVPTGAWVPPQQVPPAAPAETAGLGQESTAGAAPYWPLSRPLPHRTHSATRRS